MKQKRKNRFLAALLAAAMMFQLLPLMVFADEGAGGEGSPSYVTLKSTGDRFLSLEDAVRKAQNTDTIQLGEGKYSLYGIPSDDTTKGKDLTFVGQGPEKTVWYIGANAPDSGEDAAVYAGDDSFNGVDKVTFQNMTLRTGSANYLGFKSTNNTVVKDCVLYGRTTYWGYQSAEFIDSVFYAPNNDYALWVYSSAKATFENCTFNASGKVINIYNEGYTPTVDVYFKNCKVKSGNSGKAALNINDSTANKYTIHVTGNNDIEAATDKISCSKVFGFSGKAGNNNGHTDVYLNDELVWTNGQRRTHDYADEKATVDIGAWTWVEEENCFKRHVTEKCENCGYKKEYDEKGYKINFELNGCPNADDEIYNSANPQPEKLTLPEPSWAGHRFMGWQDARGVVHPAGTTMTVGPDTTLTAIWEEDTTGEDTTPAGGGSGDAGGAAAAVAVVVGAAGAAVLGYHLGTALLAQHYGMPYLPKNRSELALMLWEDAGKPMPNTQTLYADVSQEEQDLQCAARWARENDLLPDANKDDGQADQESRFSPDGRVSRAAALNAWRKAQELRKTA